DTGHRHGVRHVHIAPDGTWLATTANTSPYDLFFDTGDGDPVVQIWDPRTGQHLHHLDTGHRHGAGQVHIAPDGTWLATTANTSRGSGDPVVQIWDPHTGQHLHYLDTGHRHGVKRIYVEPDGTWLVTAGDTSIAIWSRTWNNIGLVRLDGQVLNIAAYARTIYPVGNRGVYAFEAILV
ncbi:WD40 repeat domain-containing protein, partial [Catellatospora aurea]